MIQDTKEGYRTWIEIDRKALKNNYSQFRSLISPSCKLMSVVKSNAYGHGLVDFSLEVIKLGVDVIGVDSIVEARRLRKEGVTTTILVLGYTLPILFPDAHALDTVITISSMDSLKKVIKQDKALRIHIKVDTGMSRQGFMRNEMDQVVSLLKKNRNKVIVEGLYTHFATAKNPSFPSETKKQIELFTLWKKSFSDAGFVLVCHAAATSGAILYPEAHFDMVRIGIGMYGFWPSKEVESFAREKMKLIPVLSWKTIIGEVKTIPAGSGVGYDFTEHVSVDTKIAICPVGYWHGLDRKLSGIGRSIVHNQEARIMGRVSMDMIIIDIGNIPNVKSGDEVTLLGEGMSAERMAYLSDTTWYETLTRINPLIKKFYV